jgi:cytochrome c
LRVIRLKCGIRPPGGNLPGVFGRRIAAGDAQLYSAALKQMPGAWDEAALDRFLRSPQTMVPGTTMQYGGIADPGLRGQVVEFFKRLK